MITKEVAAILALRVYDQQPIIDGNLPLEPEGWVKLSNPLPAINGFAYGVFRNAATNEVVISFRGTDGAGGMMGWDGANNAGLAFGAPTSQAMQAALVHVEVLKLYGADASGSNISFTGHSLGGGLASVMAALFDRPAIVFDPAPFRDVIESDFAVQLIKYVLGDAVPDALRTYVPSRDLLLREQRVMGFFAKGEFLEYLRDDGNTVNYYGIAPLAFGSRDVGMFAMHSQALLAAGILSPVFRAATVAVQSSLSPIMSKDLYSKEPAGSTERNFLLDLIRSEQASAGNSKLTHFGADLKKLGTNIAGLNQQAQEAIVAQGIEWYYWQSNNYSGQEFIDSSAGLLQYTMAKGDELAGAESRANTYVTKWLDNFFAREAVLNNTKPAPSINPDDFSQWNVATASGSISEARNQLKTQIYIGNDGVDEFTGGELNDALWGGRGDDLLYGAMGADKLYGGTGQDELYGDVGDDRLEGGAGNDKLDGGAGDDTYVVGNGIDYIKDDEAGEGNVRTDKGIVFTGGVKERPNLWKSEDESISYVFNEATGALIIMQQGLPDALTIIRDFDLEAAEGGSYLGISLRDKDEDEDPPMVSPGVGTGVARGNSWFRPGDPLVLDLDGDGVELTSSDHSVLFDHNADMIKTGSQWVRADDGLLVRDIDGNGVIDTGRELFGDQTRLNGGGIASHGFAALADLDKDANGVADGVIDASDLAFGELKVWRDLNQDGISQAHELQSLAEAGITGIGLTADSSGAGSYTRTIAASDGTTSTATLAARNVNFTVNPFYRQFTDDPVVATPAADLPQIRGSGLVRDLRQAMSLGTPEAAALAQSVSSFKVTETAQQRQAMLGQLAKDWAATSSLLDAKARNPVTQKGWYNATAADAIDQYAKTQPEPYAQLTALERFTGQALLERYVRQRSAAYYEPSEQRWKGYTYYVLEIEPERMAFFDHAYVSLKSSIYEHLYGQTIGRELFDQVRAVVVDGALRLDFSAVDDVFAAQAVQSPAQAAVNLAEFLYFNRSSLQGSDWDGAAQLAELLQTTQLDTAQSAILTGFNYKFTGAMGDTTDASLGGSYDADVLVGRAGNDKLETGSGDDILIGGQGHDQLFGGYGNDQLIGGQGNDYLNGQWGTDTYFWGAGQGNDRIADGLVNAGEQNTVVLRGLKPAEVSVELVTAEDFSRFRLTILATGETLTLDTNGWAYWEGHTIAPVRLVFADGSQWGFEEIVRQTLPLPTDGDDFLLGTPVGDRPDRLQGGAGDDVIVGRGGADVMEGGAGDDLLYGHAVISTYRDGQTVPPYWNFDVASWGDGDTYVFGRGDGRDTILDWDKGVNEDVLRFKAGVSATDLELAQRGDDLVARIKDTTDQITIRNFFALDRWWNPRPEGVYAIEQFDFADGMQWNLGEIKNAAWAGTARDDVFTGDYEDNLISGADGNDSLDGGNGDDILSGGDGNDILLGGGGDDILDGGAGNDQLYAGYGADVIRFGRGDGKDVLARDVLWSNYYYSAATGRTLNPGGNNIVALKAGVNPADVKLTRDGTTLNIQIKGTDDVLSVKDFYVTRYEGDTPVDANFSLREIRFEGGPIWGTDDILAHTMIGDDADEAFVGFGGNDTFDGGAGKDKFNGMGGLDTYLFGRGDGKDQAVGWSQHKVVFKPGVTPDGVLVRRVGTGAVLTIKDSGDGITLKNVFSPWSVGASNLAGVEFADGTAWTPGDVARKAIEGTSGDDVISDVRTASGTTMLAGGSGNDTLIGENTATVYVFNRGDGHDIVDEGYGYNPADTLRFGPDIVATDLAVSTQGDDLLIRIVGTDDQVTVKRHSSWAIENFEVGGITLSYQQMLELVTDLSSEYIYGSAGDDVLAGSGKDSVIVGFDGNDTLSGGGGADVLQGDAGNDRLSGGTERDSLIGGAGSNTYVYQRGDALDTVDLTPGASDVIQLGDGISRSDISVQFGNEWGLVGGQYAYLQRMVIGFGGNDALKLQIPQGADISSALEATGALRFADGTTMSYADLLSLADDGVIGSNGQSGDGLTLRGSQADDDIYTYAYGGAGAYLAGRGNNDRLNAYGVLALLDGGDGVDSLAAYDGGALMAGGRDADYINASSWGGEANTVAFNLGDGKDRINRDWMVLPGVLSFGVGIDPASVRMRVDSSGDLVIGIAGSEGDEIRTSWYQDDLGTPSYSRAIDKLQFVDEDGKIRLFDLHGLDARFDATALSAAPGKGLDVLARAPELEIDGPAPVHGGEAAIAYAQTGDMREGAYIAANSDLSGDNILFGTPGHDEIHAGAGNDVVMAGASGDDLYGEDGNDYLDGQGGDDVLQGGAGDDVLAGGAGNDVLDAGTGNNRALGGEGDDTYLYARGNGFLYIDDGQSSSYGEEGSSSGSDYNKIVFGEGITLGNLLFERGGNDLTVTITGAEGDTVVMAGFDENLFSRNRSIDEFVFHDGTIVALQDLWSQNSDSYLIRGGDGDLTGTDLRDDLRGGLGDDRLKGGAGDDRLQGGAGNDAYVLGHGGGNDVIVDRAGEDNIIVVSDWSVSANDVSLRTENGEAGVWIGSRFIKLEGWDGQNLAQAPISGLIFANGRSLSMADLFNQSRIIRGTPQDDVLQGGAGADVFWGLQGNDVMQGGAGADTYVIEAGSGADVITDAYAPGGENSILFLDGVQPEDIRLTLDQDRNLVLQWADGGHITLPEFDYQDPLDRESVRYFQFGADGPVLSYRELLARGFEIDGTSQNDLLYTTGLHDVVNAGAGDDVILGSAGDDKLNGGGGNDTYEYRLGDGWVGIHDVADGAGGNVVRFGEGITPELLERKLRFNYFADKPDESSLRIVFDENNVLQLNDFDPLNPEGSPHAVEHFEFADGTVLGWDQLLDKVFVVEGDTSGNELTGTSRGDRLYGYEGNDVLIGHAGDDVLTGAEGADDLRGGAGADNYVFELGDGADTIVDDGATGNTISFQAGVFEADISVERDGADFVIRYGNQGDTIRIASADGVNTPTRVIDHFELADGTLIPFAQFINHAPELGDLLQNQQGRVGEAFVFEFSGGAFVDPDGAELSYRAQLSTGDALPDWLSFDPTTRAFAGTPPLDAAGTYEVVVFAVDDSGMAMRQSFSFEVAGQLNHAPAAMEDQAAVQEDGATIASGSVLSNDSDVDANTVLTVTNAGVLQGVWGRLELNADGGYVYRLDNESAQVQSLKNGQVEADVFVYSVTDGSDTVSSQLTVSIAGTNDLPVVTADTGQVLEDGAGEVAGFVLGNDHDIDGDVLSVVEAGVWTGQHGMLTLNADGSYKYVLDNGSATVQGLQAGQVISDVFAFNVSDGLAAMGSSLSISIVGANDGPRVLADVADVFEDTQQMASGNVLANDSDVDVGTILVVAAPGTFTGTYGTLVLSGDGSYTYTLDNTSAAVQALAAGQNVTDSFNYAATDGLVATPQSLTVNVAGANDAPVLVVPVADQAATTGSLFSLTVAANTFSDIDTGDVIQYSARLATGEALPSWLTFDAITRTFSGTPGTADAGTLQIRISATDTSSASASDVFALNIARGVCYIVGSDDEDDLQGTDDDDDIDGKRGRDRMHGGRGNDVYHVDQTRVDIDDIGENDGEGRDRVISSCSYTLGANVEDITLTGSITMDATGNALDNVLIGNDKLNLIDGGVGADAMIGGLGDDVYFVDNALDVIVEFANEGVDSVASTVSYTLGANMENLALGGATALTATGNALDNILVANNSGSTLIGGAGNDIYVVGFGDTVVENANEGTDLVYSLVSYALGANQENLTLFGSFAHNGAGNELDNIIIGSIAANILAGGAGNDSYVVGAGDSVVENLNEGIDTVSSSVTFTLGANLENLSLTGTAAINGTGNAAANMLRGNAGNNTLVGGDGVDIIEGGAGDDTISDFVDKNDSGYYFGGAGADSIEGGTGRELYIGGTGNDTIQTGSGADVIAYNQGDGQDIVKASSGQDNVLSLGGGISYGNLALRVSGVDLILDTGVNESIKFESWYTISAVHTVATLQVIAEAMAGFDANSLDPLLNKKVEIFDFEQLVNTFDAARAASPGLDAWSLTNALTQFHLSGSDTDAFGGDLAYQYGVSGTLTGIGSDRAMDVLTSTQFGVQAQTLRPLATLQNGVTPLG